MSIQRKQESCFMENEHYMYVLKCSDATYYTGYTNCLERRIRLHNEGKAAKYTRCRTPVTLIYHAIFETKREAMQAEYYFKKLNRKQKEQIMESGCTLVLQDIWKK